MGAKDGPMDRPAAVSAASMAPSCACSTASAALVVVRQVGVRRRGRRQGQAARSTQQHALASVHVCVVVVGGGSAGRQVQARTVAHGAPLEEYVRIRMQESRLLRPPS